MGKYTKAVLTVIALCVLALPVKAVEKVYYCVDDASAGIYDGKAEIFAPSRFTMMIDGSVISIKEPTIIKEGKSWDVKYDLLIAKDDIYEHPDFIARSGNRTFVYYQGRYTLSMQIFGMANIRSGRCEGF